MEGDVDKKIYDFENGLGWLKDATIKEEKKLSHDMYENHELNNQTVDLNVFDDHDP